MTKSWGKMSRFTELLGIEVEDSGLGYAILTCAWKPEFENDSNVTHGGVIATIMDTACGVALVSDENGKRAGRVVTVSFSLSYIAPFREGDRVRCTARLAGGGRKLKTVKVELESAMTSDLIASGFGTFRQIASR